MDFNGAMEFRNAHIGLSGTFSNFLNHKIECLLIAPDDISAANITLVYNQINIKEQNQLALENLGFFNGSMDVYVVWLPLPNKIDQMPLAAYLQATGQK